MEQKDKVKLSVCISVHNTAEFLPRCLDSVCAQTLQSMEIVLVNNGSTDNSEEIMRDYAEKHPERCFVIVSQEDRSLAGGRQTGINHSRGKYITFLDADDLVEPTAYQKMLDCAEKERVDIVEVQTRRDGLILESNLEGLQDTHQVLKQFFTKGGIQSMLWLRMYRRYLFDKPVLPTIYTNNEDMFAWPCLLHTANGIFFIKEPLHTYSTDNEKGVMYSETTNPEFAERRFQNRKKLLLSLPYFESFVGEQDYTEYKHEHNRFKACYIYSFLMEDFVGKSIDDKVQAIIEILEYESPKELFVFLKEWLPRDGFNSYSLFRLLGIRIAYIVNHMINK